MIFNNSIIDNSFTFPLGDENSFDSDIYYPKTTPYLTTEFNIDIIKPLLENPRPKFKTELKNKKRGRHGTYNNKKREHSASSIDNIISKIQTHFLNFVICFVNDSIKGFFKYQKYKFIKFNYKEKSKVSFKYIDSMKNSTIGDLLNKMKISSKFKCSKDKNINNLKKLSQITFFRNLFKMKYLELFSKYYNNKQPLRELLIEDVIISFSLKTKTFSELLQKYKNSEDEIIHVAEKFYLNDYNTINSAKVDEEV